MTNILSILQQDIAARIEAGEFPCDPQIQVVTSVRGDIGSQIRERLAGTGLVVTVTTPRWSRGDSAVPGLLDVTVLVGIGEHARINRGPTGTRLAAEDVAVSITAILDRWRPDGGWAELDLVEATEVDGEDLDVTYQIQFRTRIRVRAVEENDIGEEI